MSLQQMLLGAGSSGKYTNITPVASDVQATVGSYSNAGTLAGAANANRWVAGYMFLPAGYSTFTIGGITPTVVALGSGHSYFYANVPTGSATAISLTGIGSGNLMVMVAYSFNCASTPSMSVLFTGTFSAQPFNSVVPATGFAIALALANSPTTYPTFTGMSGNYTARQGPTQAFFSNYYVCETATNNSGATGSQTVSFTFTGASGVNGNVLYFT